MSEEKNPLEFKDTAGNVWNLKINLAVARRIDESDFGAITELKFSMLEPDQEFFALALGKASFSLALIWVIIQDQIPTSNLKTNPDDFDALELEFIKNIDGDVLDSAKKALLSALADFCPDQRNALSILQRQNEKAIHMANLELSSKENQLEEMIKSEIQKASKEADSYLSGERGIGS